MILCFAFISTGCLGLSREDYENFDDEALEESKIIDMYGTKVLYRPDEYDYDVGSGATEGETNNYYGAYAYHILNMLFRVYGLTDGLMVTGNEGYRGGYLPNFNEENLSYLYDSIRYQVDSVGRVTLTQKVEVDQQGNIINYLDQPVAIADSGGAPYYILGADTLVRWNWTLAPTSNTSTENLKAYAYNGENTQVGNEDSVPLVQGDRVYLNSDELPSTAITSYYAFDRVFSSTLYESIYLSSNLDTALAPNDQEAYSDYVRALEYVIYCYAVDLEPGEIYVTINDDYTYDIEVQINDNYRGSLDEALEVARQTFIELGAYVGLVDRQIENIEQWILNNIIGATALEADDTFTNYTSGVIEYLVVDENGDYVLNDKGDELVAGYGFGQASSSEFILGRDYATAVENIVTDVCNNVTIGNVDGEDVTIDNRFPASSIMEYAGNTFVIGDDSNFVAPGEGELNELGCILPLEYQSVVLMLDREIYLDGIRIAFKYDADLDGTEEGVYDPSKYIDIIVDLNYYNSQTRQRQVLASKQIRVYDGPYDASFRYDYDIQNPDPNDWPAEGPDVPENLPRDHTSVLNFDNLGQIHIGEFDVDIGEGALMTDVGTVGNYTSRPYVSTEPLTLIGTSRVINYYEVVEYGSNPEYDTDQLPDRYTYISGRFKHTAFGGSCDYIEITYKVIKLAGDTTTNYKFYTGLAGVDYNEEPYAY